MDTFATGGPGGPHTLPVRGAIDLDSIDRLDAEFARAVSQHPAVVRVDLSHVEFCDSMGLDAFIRWHRTAQRSGFHMVFVAPPKCLQRLLGLTHLDELLTIER